MRIAAMAGMVLVGAAICLSAGAARAQSPARWLTHDMQRPRPPVVTPGAPQLPLAAPSDAEVLFDGGSLDQWRDAEGGPAKWTVADGVMESVPNSGYIYTADTFGDVQLHVEWAAPVPAKGRSQGRGNSGVFLMGLYEVQVLDSYENETYADGQAAAIYGQYPPLVNACRPPGEWQSYDIVFRRPRFHRDGTLAQAARITVIHNGVLVQDNVELWGPTTWLQNRAYQAHADRLPISLQDHGNPVRYRNIWLRRLRETDEPPPPAGDEPKTVHLPTAELAKFAGRYGTPLGDFGQIELLDGRLQLKMEAGQVIDLVPRSPTQFAMRWTAATLDFNVRDGEVTGFTMHLAGERYPIGRKQSSE